MVVSSKAKGCFAKKGRLIYGGPNCYGEGHGCHVPFAHKLLLLSTAIYVERYIFIALIVTTAIIIMTQLRLLLQGKEYELAGDGKSTRDIFAHHHRLHRTVGTKILSKFSEQSKPWLFFGEFNLDFWITFLIIDIIDTSFLSASSSCSRFYIFKNLVVLQHISQICVIFRIFLRFQNS